MTPKATAALVLALVFGAGALVGVSAARFVGAPKPPPEPLPGLDGLDLSPAQRARARAVIDAHRPELEAVLVDVEPRLKPIRDKVETELRRDVLTPEQGRRLDEIKRASPRPLP